MPNSSTIPVKRDLTLNELGGMVNLGWEWGLTKMEGSLGVFRE